jgi:hypothetical protein
MKKLRFVVLAAALVAGLASATARAYTSPSSSPSRELVLSPAGIANYVLLTAVSYGACKIHAASDASANQVPTVFADELGDLPVQLTLAVDTVAIPLLPLTAWIRREQRVTCCFEFCREVP